MLYSFSSSSSSSSSSSISLIYDYTWVGAWCYCLLCDITVSLGGIIWLMRTSYIMNIMKRPASTDSKVILAWAFLFFSFFSFLFFQIRKKRGKKNGSRPFLRVGRG